MSATGSGVLLGLGPPPPLERHPGCPLRAFTISQRFAALPRGINSCSSMSHALLAPWSPTPALRSAHAFHARAPTRRALPLVPPPHALATIFMGRLHPRRSAASYRHAAAITPARLARVRSMFARLPGVASPTVSAPPALASFLRESIHSGAVVSHSTPRLFAPQRLAPLSVSHPPTAYHRGTGVSRLCLVAFPPSLLCAYMIKLHTTRSAVSRLNASA